MRNIIVVGGGPAGMMASIEAKRSNPNDNVFLLERNRELGKKLLLTGGGRCNVSANVTSEEFIKSVPKNGKFLYSAISQFDLSMLRNFFETRGCPLIEEDHKRLFPKSGSAKDIRQVLISEMKKQGVRIKYDCYVKNVDVKNSSIYTSDGDMRFDALILACGGMSFSDTGSDGTGYELARAFNHSISKLLPMESALVSTDPLIMSRELQGLSFRDVELSLYNDKGKKKSTLTHDLLITHFGLSGPLALRSSYEISKLLEKQSLVECRINFNKSSEALPKRLIQYVEREFEDTQEALSQFKINVCDIKSIKQAFVTNGGVNVKEIDPKTMKSKLYDGLSFCGEMIDVSGYTGGYNISTALITGVIAGRNI